jgi:EAL domain-containing protein (putative c-di-GMP-specific phosphodiesterase class I)
MNALRHAHAWLSRFQRPPLNAIKIDMQVVRNLSSGIASLTELLTY